MNPIGNLTEEYEAVNLLLANMLRAKNEVEHILLKLSLCRPAYNEREITCVESLKRLPVAVNNYKTELLMKRSLRDSLTKKLTNEAIFIIQCHRIYTKMLKLLRSLSGYRKEFEP